jgi:arylsulfatase A-like enzyme
MKPNVIWISLESVRADATSLHRTACSPTPNLARIAAQDSGQRFGNCFAHAHWTPASTTSILTGVYPSSHGVGYADVESVTTVPDGVATVPELLADEGYRTALFGGNTFVSEATGLDRGFDTCRRTSATDMFTRRGLEALGRHIADHRYTGFATSTNVDGHKDSLREWHQYLDLRRWVSRQRGSDRPFFAYVHLNNSHSPFRPPPSVLSRVVAGSEITPEAALTSAAEFDDSLSELMANRTTLDPDQRQAVVAAYEAEVRYDDYFIGKIFECVQAGDDTILVVTGDHGELFGEGGAYGHNMILHDKLLHVPLVVYGLDLEESSTDGLVQHIDIMQTILAQIGADVSQFQGYDLRADRRGFVIAQRGSVAHRIEKFREINSAFEPDLFHETELDCIRSREWKYQRSDDREELFRLPDEQTDVSERFGEKTRELRRALRDRLPVVEYDSAERAEFNEAMKDRLRDMGYIE